MSCSGRTEMPVRAGVAASAIPRAGSSLAENSQQHAASSNGTLSGTARSDAQHPAGASMRGHPADADADRTPKNNASSPTTTAAVCSCGRERDIVNSVASRARRVNATREEDSDHLGHAIAPAVGGCHAPPACWS
jgi:hypothetical protein